MSAAVQAGSSRPARRAWKATLAAASSEGIRLNCWKTMPMVVRRSAARARSSIAVTSAPFTAMRPRSGVSSAATRWRSVDLPEPLSPVSASVSPAVERRGSRRRGRRPGRPRPGRTWRRSRRRAASERREAAEAAAAKTRGAPSPMTAEVTSPTTMAWSPPSWIAWARQSKRASASSISGTPSGEASRPRVPGLAVVGEGAGEGELVVAQDVDGEVGRLGEGVEAARGAGGGPQDEGRVERERGEAVRGDAEGADGAVAGHERDAGREAAERVAEGAFRVGAGGDLHGRRPSSVGHHGTSCPVAAARSSNHVWRSMSTRVASATSRMRSGRFVPTTGRSPAGCAMSQASATAARPGPVAAGDLVQRFDEARVPGAEDRAAAEGRPGHRPDALRLEEGRGRRGGLGRGQAHLDLVGDERQRQRAFEKRPVVGREVRHAEGADLAFGHERLEDAGGLAASMNGSGRWRRRRSIRSIRILASEASTEARMWRAEVS
jgi:hypothetical protein